jgi:glycosyltransferase involved in cell wall biosynthesis
VRILHLITHLRLGAGRAIVDLAIQQAQSNTADVRVALADDAEGNWRSDAHLLEELSTAGIPVCAAGDFFHRAPGALSASVARLRSLLAEWGAPSVVHAHTAMGGAVARWAGAPRVVVTCHGWNTSRPAEYDLQDALAFSLADAIVSPSSYWAERIAALPGRLRPAVISNGFDVSRYPALSRDAAGDRLRIACVGELTARKGQDVLLEAMPHVWAQHPGAELHLLGDGDASVALHARGAQLDPTGGRVVFHGYVPNAYSFLAHCDLLCLPARSDNQPVAIIEAMLAELPVVATRVGGIPEMIAGAGCGVVTSPGSAIELAQAICAYRDAARRVRDGRNGRRFAETEYNRRVTATRLLTLYADVTACAA